MSVLRHRQMPGQVSGPVVATAAAAALKPLKVCSVAYTFYASDGRVMRYNQALAARGAEVDVIALRRENQPRITEIGGVTVTGVQTRKINERGPLSYLGRILMFAARVTALLSWRQIRRRYDLIHVHSVPDLLVFTAWLPKLMGAKIILDIHDVLPELYASKFRISQQSAIFKALLIVERWSAAFADHVIAANDLWHEKLAKRSAAPAKTTSLLNYPDRSIFRRQGRTRRDGKFVMLYPGSLNWHQGVDIAIDAFARIKERVQYAELHICGAGPALPSLVRQVESLGLGDRVRFSGPIPLREIARLMENADLGVVPKRTDSFGDEAFSTKILEFMAMGVPVIVSGSRIDRYYFDDSLVKFFPSASAEDLAKAMLELINDSAARNRLAEHGLRYVESNCWEVKKQIYLNLVDSLAVI